ncbi:MAG: hypothetical protein QN157_03310 [Armatimonadota bacterium]|nr:hypothetical protein [Armatimonadota bacterium]
MSLWRRLGAFLRARAPTEDDTAIVFYVRCDRCGEVIAVRVDRRWDLVQEFDDGIVGYSLHKEVLGSRCNRLLTVRMTFDRHYALVEREVEGGRFATREEYDAARTQRG